MKTYRKWLTYSLYGFILTVLFLYVCFPAGPVKRYIQSQIRASAAGAQVRIGDLGVGFPPAMVMERVDIEYQRGEPVRLERVSIKPAYLHMIRGKGVLVLDAAVGGGQIRGNIGLPGASQNGRSISVALDIREVGLASLGILERMGRGTMAGELTGNIDYTGEMAGRGNGNAAFVARNCQLRLTPALLGVEELNFSEIQADARITPGRVTVPQFSLKGTQFSGTGSGTIRLSAPIETSRMNISAELTLHPPLIRATGGMLPKQYTRQGGLPVRITGTPERPKLSIR